jgi:glycosyltransferase involved in cell wall biosynthesis
VKIVFYHDDLRKINLENIYTKGASGTVSSLMWLAKGLSELSHEVIILNSSQSMESDYVTFIQTFNEDSLVSNLLEIEKIDIFIAVGSAGYMFHNLNLEIPVKIFWLHNYISHTEQYKFDIDIKEKRLDRIICVGKHHLSTLSHINNFNRCSYIYNSINLNLIPALIREKHHKNIAFVGSVTEAKGLHNVLKIILELSKIRKDFKFFVFGSVSIYGNESIVLGKSGVAEESYEDNFLKKYLYKNNSDELHDFIVLKGGVGRNELYNELEGIDLCLQDLNWSGSSETFGVGTLEEQALGIPVITNFRGGQPEVLIHNVTGFILKDKTEKKVIDKINYILDLDNEAYCNISNNAKKNAMNFDYKLISKEWELDLKKISNDVKYIFVKKIYQSYVRKLRLKLGV